MTIEELLKELRLVIKVHPEIADHQIDLMVNHTRARLAGVRLLNLKKPMPFLLLED